jgi:RNase P subunit RPR2
MNDSSASSEESRLRMRFVLFVKILFKLLAQSEDELLLEQAKLTVFVCTRQRKQQLPQSHSHYFSEASLFQTPMNTSLRNEIKIKLCEQIGDSLWTKAEAYTRMYEARKKAPTSSSSTYKSDLKMLMQQQQRQQQQQQQQNQIPHQQQQQMMDQQSEAHRQALVPMQCLSQYHASFNQNIAWTKSNLFVRNTSASFNSTAV